MPILKPGDTVEIIAPASRSSDLELSQMQELLESWGLTCIVHNEIFGKDLLCANTDEKRFENLQRALENPITKAVICVRGGYGSMRLIPRLAEIRPSFTSKIFIGMSDTTALQLYLQQNLNWPIIHGSLAPEKFSPESISAFKSILFEPQPNIYLTGLTPLNPVAKTPQIINSSISGGNLSIIQAGIGTNWQLNARDKMILLEEVGERAYRVDRMLEHLLQANILQSASAIILADFIGGNEPNGTSLIDPVLNRFAKNFAKPVFKIQGIGHGYVNHPIPFGTQVILEIGSEIKLSMCSIAW